MDISEYISLSVIDDKSQYYWNNFYRYWIDENNSLEFLKANIKNTDNLAKNYIDPLETFKHYLEEQDLKEATKNNNESSVKQLFFIILNFKIVI